MAERRASQRVSLNMLVQIRNADMDEFMREHADNISAGGMFIRTRDPSPVGTMICFQFRLEDGSRVFEGLGKVVHVNPPTHAVAGMGLEFVNLDRNSKQLIDSIIERRLVELGEVATVPPAATDRSSLDPDSVR